MKKILTAITAMFKRREPPASPKAPANYRPISAETRKRMTRVNAYARQQKFKNGQIFELEGQTYRVKKTGKFTTAVQIMN